MLAGIGLLVGVWRFCILAFSVILGRIGTTNGWPDRYEGMRLWRFSIRHDAEWYLSIARDGYTDTSSAAFFPGLPLAISLADRLLPGSDVFAALIVVHLALVGALIYVFKLARLDAGDGIAWWTLGLLLMFPWAVYYSAVYPQALLLLALAGALYHARRGQ
jgi:Gpi18-like mannosyltransferase